MFKSAYSTVLTVVEVILGAGGQLDGLGQSHHQVSGHQQVQGPQSYLQPFCTADR